VSDPADDFDMEEDCPNCGGEGVIYMCVSEYACIDPESGCELCERRCDWCRPTLLSAKGGET
jgi:hypothetical protein